MDTERAERLLRALPALRLRLEALEAAVDGAEACLDALSETDRRVLEVFYMAPEYGTVVGLQEELGVGKSTLYRWKQRSLHRFSQLFERIYVGRSWDDSGQNVW